MQTTAYSGRMTDFIAGHFEDKELYGAEMGVFEGDGALRILTHSGIAMTELMLVDPYDYYPEYKDYSEPRIKEALHVAKKRLAGFSPYIRWVFLTAEEATQMLFCMDAYLNFAYLDHNHFAEYVYPDIWNCTAVVLPGGIIGGHDFGFSRATDSIPKVREAVALFQQETGVEIIQDRSQPGLEEDWWFVVSDEIHCRAVETFGKHKWSDT